jgi:signal transduction histidine kinase
VAVVSHDLRNPMTVISMLCGMMQKTFSSDGPHTSRRISTAIDTMQQAAGRMNTLLEDLLDTSKIDAGRYTIAGGPGRRADVRGSAIPAGAAGAGQGHQHLVQADPDLQNPCRPGAPVSGAVEPDRQRDQVHPAPRFVGVLAKSDGKEIVFTVRDTGEGIPKENLARVFDRYWTVKEGNPTGTGLGLYITQGIVEAHGGRIEASSEPGEGTEFRFTVPAMLTGE